MADIIRIPSFTYCVKAAKSYQTFYLLLASSFKFFKQNSDKVTLILDGDVNAVSHILVENCDFFISRRGSYHRTVIRSRMRSIDCHYRWPRVTAKIISAVANHFVSISRTVEHYQLGYNYWRMRIKRHRNQIKGLLKVKTFMHVKRSCEIETSDRYMVTVHH